VNLHEMAALTADIAEGNGFAAPTWDTLPMKLMLAITELREARDSEDRAALAEELADFALRTLAVLNRIWGDDWASSRIEGRQRTTGSFFYPIEVLLFPMISHLCFAVEDWRKERRVDAKIRIELALLELWRLADRLGIDLETELMKKCEKNRGRGHLHGKVRAEG
jgi:NTP pyrophosphatase (non-canonical NTP hydrolase)